MATLRSPTPHFGGPHFGGPRFGGPPHGFMPRGLPGGGFGERLGFNFRPSMPGQGGLSSYDGKKLRTKPLVRKTVDYSSSVNNFIKVSFSLCLSLFVKEKKRKKNKEDYLYVKKRR